MTDHYGSIDRSRDDRPARCDASADPPLRRRAPSGDRVPLSAGTVAPIGTGRPANPMIGPLLLFPEQIEAPAFFVDGRLAIRWIAPGGTDRFSRSLYRQVESATTRDVFNILLRSAIKHALADWPSFFAFIYRSLHRATARATVDAGPRFISRNRHPSPTDTGSSGAHAGRFRVDSTPLVGDADAGIPPLRLFALQFGEGTLYLLRSDPAAASPAVEPATGDAMGIGSTHGKSSLAILSARLNDSHRLAEAMLPDRFVGLMVRIREEADRIVRALGGRRAGCRGGEICVVFGESAGRDPVFSAICSATRLNDRMARLEQMQRTHQGWSHEICLNMGISHGWEDATSTDPSKSAEFVVPGGAFDQSTRLSAAAGKGEIWITKAAVSHLPKALVDQVVLGAWRQGAFLRNVFTRLSDLPADALGARTGSAGGELRAARVLRIDRPGPVSTSAREV